MAEQVVVHAHILFAHANDYALCICAHILMKFFLLDSFYLMGLIFKFHKDQSIS